MLTIVIFEQAYNLKESPDLRVMKYWNHGPLISRFITTSDWDAVDIETRKIDSHN